MVTVVEARDLEEDHTNIEASVGDLVEAEAMAKKTWEFG